MIEFSIRIALTILCLGFVVVIHELGHLVMARRLGVRVERFTVGFGPEVFGWTASGIRYAVCIVPLGGMVKLAGEFLDERKNNPDEFFSQPWYRRNLIALAGPLPGAILFLRLQGASGCGVERISISANEAGCSLLVATMR